MPGFADHFSTVAADYAAYRPHYPPALVDALAGACPHHALAWDVGCGSGQLSVALADRFATVIATDPSAQQLAQATARAGVTYRCEPAEASTLAAGSADLIVAAQAAHWFDFPRFVAEVARVARQGAVAALVSYNSPSMAGEAGAILARFYREIVGPFWPPQRRHVENGYAELVLPWPALASPELAMTARWSRDALVGYLGTWSATVAMVRARGTAPLEAVRAELSAVWPADELRAIHWPLTVRLATVVAPLRGTAAR